MAEETTQATEGTTTAANANAVNTSQTVAAAQSGQTEHLFTQEELNKQIGERLKRERAKFSDYEEIKAKAEAADARADYDDIKAERDKLIADIAHRDLLDKVMAETGVPRELIHGETEEEMRASAMAVTAYAETFKPSHPTDKGGAATPAPTTRASILAIKDEDARRKAIAENIELFG